MYVKVYLIMYICVCVCVRVPARGRAFVCFLLVCLLQGAPFVDGNPGSC